MPFVRFLGYYALLILIGYVLIRFVPAAERAFLSPITVGGLVGPSELLSGDLPAAVDDATLRQRALTTALMALGTFAVVVPVAWVYMFTRRFRYDRALVQSVMILPLVVAGMVMIVKNSLALAFSLAGIVAAVRFRNTLKDTRDAVYIFLALGLGLAGGVQALDIAVVMSLAFNLLVLGLWRTNFAAVYGADRRGDMLAIGDPTLRLARTHEEVRELKAELATEAVSADADGALIVQGPEADALRVATEAVLHEAGDTWTYGQPRTGTDGNNVLSILVRFKKKATPVEVLGDLDEYWSAHVTAAEYIPFTTAEKNDDDGSA